MRKFSCCFCERLLHLPHLPLTDALIINIVFIAHTCVLVARTALASSYTDLM